MKSSILRKILAGSMAIAMVAGTGVSVSTGNLVGTNISVSAAETLTEGDYEYQINDNGTVTITKYIGESLTVTIPSKIANTTVESIGNNAFRESKITSVKFPSTLKTIGEAAFYKCYYLKDVTFPSGLTTIGQYAFEQCNLFTKIVLPDTVTTLGSYAFRNCPGVTSITLSKGLTSLPYDGFSYCNITEITIPDAVETLNNYAFYSCRNLKKVNFGTNSALKKINYQVFYNCSALESFTCPASLEAIGQDAFYNCRSLATVTFNDTLKTISYSSFQNCVSLKTVTFPANLEYIDSNSFNGCTSLETVRTGGLKRICNSSFKNCTSLKNVYFGENFERIDNEAFYNTPSLTNFYTVPQKYIYIEDHAFDSSGWMSKQPDGIVYFGGVTIAVKGTVKDVVIKDGTKWINNTTFKNTSGIKSITIPASIITDKTPNFFDIFDKCGNTLEAINFTEDDTRYTSIDGIVYSKDKQTLIYCPRAKSGTVNVDDETVTINSSAFTNCNNVKILNFGMNVKSFSEYEIGLNMANLEAVNVPSANINFKSEDGVIYNKTKTYLYLYPNAKKGAYTMPDTLESVYYYAFQNAKGLTEINVGDTMKSLNPGDNFINNPALKAINVDENNQWYSSVNGVLYTKDKTKLYKVPDAYAGDVVIPDTVTSIAGQYTFNNCTGIKKLTIPAATSVGDSTFDYVKSITEFVVDAENTKVQAVNGCLTNLAKDYIYAIPKGAATVTLPENIVSTDRIRDRAFMGCPNLVTLNLSKNFNSFSIYYKFDDCPKLAAINANADCPDFTTVDGVLYNKNVTRIMFVPGAKTGTYTVPTTVNEIYDYAFKDAKKLTSITFPKNFLNTFDIDDRLGNCDSLTSLNFADINKNYTTVNGIVYNKDMSSLLYVPNAKSGSYTIPNSVKSIESRAFYNCSKLTEIVFPESITQINFNTTGMTSLKSITIPASVTEIGSNFYSNFPNLTISGYEGSYAEFYSNYNDIKFNKLPNSISLNKSLIQTTVGKTAAITATIDTTRTTNKTITWKSSNTNVATVKNGTVTAVAAGYAKISATTADGKVAYCDVSINPALANVSTISSDNVVLGDSVTMTGAYYGGLGTVKYNMLYKLSTDTSWTTLSAYSTTSTATFTPEKAGTYDLCIKVKDGENTEVKSFFTLNVNAALTNNSSVADSSITLGESVVMLGNASGGKGNITYKYEQKLSTASTWTTVKDYSASGAAVFKPSTAGTYNLRITAKDSTGKTAAKTLNVAVTGVLANTSELSKNTINLGDSVTVKASATGGQGSYTYAYFYKKFTQTGWTTVSNFSTTATATVTPKESGYYQICVKVKDADGTIAKEYYNVVVNETQQPSSELKNTSVVSPTQIKLGERVSVKASAEGGKATYTYAVFYKKTTDTKWTTKQNFSTTAETSVLPSKAADYEICVKVKDADGNIVKKNFNVKVTSDQAELQNNSTIASDKIVLGNSLTVNAKAAGGAGDYTYAVLYKKNTDTSWTTKQNFTTNTTVTVKPSSVAAYDLCVKVKDAQGNIVKKFFTFSVVEGVQNTSTISATAITLGQTITMTGSAKGGTSPYTYAFYYKKKSDANWTEKQSFAVNNTVYIKPSKAVEYDLCVKVQDKNGIVEKKYFTVTVK